MCGDLALVESFVVLPRALYPQRPVTEMSRVFHQKPVIAAVRGQSHGQQLEVFPPKPGHLERFILYIIIAHHRHHSSKTGKANWADNVPCHSWTGSE